MVTYVVLAKFTDQGIRNAKDSPKRADAFKEMAKTFGVTVKDIVWTQGRYDVVTIVEAPDESSAMSLNLSLGALGNIRTETLRAFSAALARCSDNCVRAAATLQQRRRDHANGVHGAAQAPCALSLAHRHLFALGPMLASVEPHRAERERQPAEIVGKAYHQNDPAGNRSDGGTIGKFRQGRSRRRMDCYLAVIGNHLDGENPSVVATQPPPRRADKRDVMAGRSVVARENRLPAIVAGFTGEYRRVEIHLQPTSSGAPDIEIAIPPRLHTEKHGNEQSYEQEW